MPPGARRGARRRTGAAVAGAGPHPEARHLPAGEDPDTLVRRQGAGGMRDGAGRRHAAGRCAVRPAARGRRRGNAGAARGVPTRLERRRGASPTGRSPANTAGAARPFLCRPPPDRGRRRPRTPRRAPHCVRPPGCRGRRHRTGAYSDRDPAAPSVLLRDVEHAYAALDLRSRSLASARRYAMGRIRPKSLTLRL